MLIKAKQYFTGVGGAILREIHLLLIVSIKVEYVSA